MHRGFSLIELMVALAISLLLTLGISYIFLGSKQTYKVEENLARMQESGRLAFLYLTRDVRTAGDFGCASKGMAYATGGVSAACTMPAATAPTLTCVLAGTGCTDIAFDPKVAIYGYEATSATAWGPALPASLTGKPKGNTDVIVVRSSIPSTVSVNRDAGTSDIGINEYNADLAQGEILMVSDCKSSILFQSCTHVATAGSATIGHGTSGCEANLSGQTTYGNACGTWSTNFTGGSIIKPIQNSYFVHDVDGVPTLHRRNIKNADEILVPNVENIQIKFGVAATVDDYPTSYKTAKEVNDDNAWDKVKSARIEILVRSPDDNITTDHQKYFFNGADVTATDKRLRLVMSTTVSIRNRTLMSSK